MPVNPYESGKQKVIPAVLLYAFYKNKILMMHRNVKANDIHEGKWNGLGGKLEVNESFVEAASREFAEEAFADVPNEQWKFSGQLFFPNFKAQKNEDWMVNVFTTHLTDEQASKVKLNDPKGQTMTPEGSLHFVEREQVLTLNLWDGDHHFIPYVLSGTLFTGTFFYENGKCARFALTKI